VAAYGRLRLKLGKFDVNAEFAYSDDAVEFIYLSPSISPTILELPSDPDPSTGVGVFFYPSDTLYLSFGLFDGALHAGVPTGSRGPKTFFNEPADLFVIGEVGVTWWRGESRNDGRLSLGFWGHTGTFDRWQGGTEDGTSGVYLVCDQRLWRENWDDLEDEQGAVAFLQLGWADDEVAEVDFHVGGGVTWIGPIPNRDEDALGIMASLVHFSEEAQSSGAFTEDFELAVETFYKIQITPWSSVKPDLQWIVNPGGDRSLGNAFVGTIRFEIAF